MLIISFRKSIIFRIVIVFRGGTYLSFWINKDTQSGYVILISMILTTRSSQLAVAGVLLDICRNMSSEVTFCWNSISYLKQILILCLTKCFLWFPLMLSADALNCSITVLSKTSYDWMVARGTLTLKGKCNSLNHTEHYDLIRRTSLCMRRLPTFQSNHCYAN